MAATALKNIWDADGPVSRACARLNLDYAPRDAQQKMAANVEAALRRQVANTTQILPIEAATGTGKTLAYMVPCALHAAASQSRILISTHTIALGNQIMAHEGPIVQEIVTTAYKRTPLISHMRGQKHFLSPSRLRSIANLMRDDGATAKMLGPLYEAANQAQNSIDQAAEALTDGDTSPSLQAIIRESFIDLIEEKFELEFDRDQVCLLSASSDHEKSAHALSRELANNADILITTHAYTALSLARRQLFGAETETFDCLIIDEADQWASAADSISMLSVTMDSLKRSIDSVIAASTRSKNRNAIEHAGEKALAILDGLAALAPETPNDKSMIANDDQSFRELRKLTRSMKAIKMETANSRSHVASAVDDLASRTETLMSLERIVASKNSDYWTARWKTSPVRAEPRIEVVGAAPGRVLKRIWNQPDDSPPLARTVILTSATLATPGFGSDSRLKSICIETGIDLESNDVLKDLFESIEPEKFGRLKFKFADPKAPIPRLDSNGVINIDSVKYIAETIIQAHKEVPKNGRTLVLVPSYNDVERIAEYVPGCTAHQRGTSTNDIEALYKGTPGICLITPALWVGTNLPGLIQALVIAKLPNPPRDDDDQIIGALSSMLKKLAQGIGRAIRGPTDNATVWFADPRVPIPECITEDTGILRSISTRSKPQTLAAIPRRFFKEFGKTPGIATLGVRVTKAEPQYRQDNSAYRGKQNQKSTTFRKAAKK
jgi:Rad3-related DNA helicase